MTAYTYDAKGNTLTVTKLATTPQAVTTTFGYDAKGNRSPSNIPEVGSATVLEIKLADWLLPATASHSSTSH